MLSNNTLPGNEDTPAHPAHHPFLPPSPPSPEDPSKEDVG